MCLICPLHFPLRVLPFARKWGVAKLCVLQQILTPSVTRTASKLCSWLRLFSGGERTLKGEHPIHDGSFSGHLMGGILLALDRDEISEAAYELTSTSTQNISLLSSLFVSYVQ